MLQGHGAGAGQRTRSVMSAGHVGFHMVSPDRHYGKFLACDPNESGSRRISTEPRRTEASCRVEAEIRTGEERDMDRRWVRLVSGVWGAVPVCGSVGLAVPCVQTLGASYTQFIMWCSLSLLFRPTHSLLQDTLLPLDPTSSSPPLRRFGWVRRAPYRFKSVDFRN